MTFDMGGSRHSSPEVALSAALSPTTIVAAAAIGTNAPQYPVTTDTWTTYSTSHSALAYGCNLPMPDNRAGGYPSDTDWSAEAERNSFSHSPASGFDLPMQDSGLGTHGYSTPYSYPYHSEFEAASPYIEATAPSNQRRHSKHLEPSSSSSRTRRRYPLSPPPPSVPISTRSSAHSKLRSASRASKNNHLNPPATEEERKTRASHNQVEKQYRNRLNAHFEALLDTLPEYMRGGEDEDDGDRKISKAEVLEMARRYITHLERELTATEGERDELKDNVERLRWFVTKSEDANGKGSIGTPVA